MANHDDDDVLRPPTPEVDPKVAQLVSKLQTPSQANDDRLPETEVRDEDLFAALEDEDDAEFAALREKRLEALQSEISRVKDMREMEHGRYTEITDEKEVIKTSAKEARCVIHFYHRDFHRCKIMDKHLEMIAPHHFKTRFIRVFVENVPWLVEKLQIKILPCVICFMSGVTKDRLIGFEELGNDDAFTTAALELRLSQSGVIDIRSAKPAQLVSKYTRSAIRGRESEDEEEYRSDE